MWLWLEWIPKEQQDVNLTICDTCAKLLIATKWTTPKSFYVKASLFGD
jgi:hypothetical protein